MRRIGVSFAIAVLLLGGFLYVLNPVRLASYLAVADPFVFALGLVGVVLALVCWSDATRRLFESSQISLSRRRAFVAYGTGAFGKQILPMGNASGPAVMAYAFDRETELDYSRTLGVIVVAEFLSLAASIILAIGGIAILFAYGAPTETIRWLGIGVAGVVAILAVLSLVIWYRRAGVTAVVVRGARFLQPVIATVLPRGASWLEPQRLVSGLNRYYASVDEVLADRQAVLMAAFMTQLGWIFFIVPLYTSGLALGVRLPLALVLFLVPAAGLATAFPLPGGLGGLEIALVALLTALSVLELTESGAIVVLYRLCSYWFFVLIGGICASITTAGITDLTDAFGTPIAASRQSTIIEDEPE